MTCSFNDKEFTFSQPDGSKVQVKGWGNGHHAVFETLDGFTVVKDPVTNYYQYARLSADKNCLEPAGAVIGLVDPETLGLMKHIRVSEEAAKKIALTAFNQMGSMSRWQERREEIRTARRTASETWGIFEAPPIGEIKGDYFGLCILIQFPDVPGNIPQSEVQDFCNKKGYGGFGNNGSVFDYYYDVSRGKLRYRNIVTSYYNAKNPKSYYTNPEILPFGNMARELIEEALLDLKTKKFDFSELSIDATGYIYALNVFYAGPCINEWCKGLWPHSGSLASPFEVGKDRKIYDYQISSMGGELKLGTFCHENGHMICHFPDLYDYSNQSNGVGEFCLMCCVEPEENNPRQFCGYLKHRAGWADKVTNLIEGVYTANADKNEFFIYSKSPTEYFLIENRINKNRDSSLPASGLAIWHIDEQGSNENEETSPAKHYECSLVQADNSFHLERRINFGDEKDLYGGPIQQKFGDSTSPNSKWLDGTSSGLEIIAKSSPSNEISFKVTIKK